MKNQRLFAPYCIVLRITDFKDSPASFRNIVDVNFLLKCETGMHSSLTDSTAGRKHCLNRFNNKISLKLKFLVPSTLLKAISTFLS